MSGQAGHELTRVLEELHRLQRELVEQRYVRRADGLERIDEGLRRIGEVGSPAGIVDRAAAELGAGSELDVVLVSRLAGGRLEPLALWIRDDPARADAALAALASRPLTVGYPLVEADVAQRHEAALVSVAASGRRAAPALTEVLGWEAYVVADVAVEGRTVGLLHAARDHAIDELDLEFAERYAAGLGRAFERAVLREQLQRQQRQLDFAGRWISGQMRQLSLGASPAGAPGDGGDAEELLTQRELDVLGLVARGQSNRAIASALMIGEGTVKYHVKNILRKLQARSRAEAVSRYVRMYGDGR